MASLNEHEKQINDLKNTKANSCNPTLIGKVSISNDGDSIVFNKNGEFVGVGGAIYGGQKLGFWHGKSKSGVSLTETGDWIVDGGNVSANKVYNACWNDYAELYEKGEETEAGDIIGLNPISKKEEYIKATDPSMCIGVHSDEYGHLIGGENAPEGEDFLKYNLKKFIPVGLVGRVRTKITGLISMGDKVVLSSIPGVGRKYIKGIDSPEDIIGMAVENKVIEEIARVRVNLHGGV